MRVLRALIYLSLILVVAQSHAQLLDIPDPNLKQAILETLNLPDEIPLTQQEMSRLTNLDAEERGIIDLTGLEYAINIKSLRLDNNPIAAISPLAHLTKLEGVHLLGCDIVDLSPLGNLKNLRGLFLGHNQISDISPLAELTNLTTLHLQSNQIVDLRPLANLINLWEFWIQDNSVEDITILANLTQLTVLRLDNNQIRDISPLVHLTQLEELHVADNPFYDFSPLLKLEGVELDIEISEGFNIVVEIPDPNLKRLIREALSLPEGVPLTQQQMLRLTRLEAGGDRGITNLTGLEYATNIRSLRLHNNPIVDISLLFHLTKLEGVHLLGCGIVDLNPLRNLKNLRGVFLGHNQISDISALAELTNLTALHLQSNQIVDLNPLVNLINLREFWIQDNSVEDITILANLTQLTHLRLYNNQIRDISSLSNLTLLEELWLNRNEITDVTPLIGLTNLMELHIADNPFHDFSPLLKLEGVELDIEISEALNVVVEVPDPNLRQLIREALSLPEVMPLTQQQMLRLTRLEAGGNRGITDLTGIEYATNLQSLGLYHNPIVDISPLAHLTKLEGFNLWGCSIVNLSPLRNLTNLRGIVLGNNQISDISPLAELTNLTFLQIHSNRIVDFSPLANLINLRELWINDNFGTDISPLQGLNLTDFRYDEVCDIEPLLPLARDRIENRNFPSVFQIWNDVVGLDHLTWEQRNVLHDLYVAFPRFGLNWDTTLAEPTYGVATQRAGSLERAREIRQQRLAQNPNMIFLPDVRIYHHDTPEAFPPDSDFWLRDAQGQIIRNANNEYLIDFLKPEVQKLLIKRIIALERCGFYDGVFLDGFHNNFTGFMGRQHYPVTHEEIIQVMLNILRAVRSQVREDFLVLINTNRTKATRYTEYVNGTFMETLTDNHFSDNPGGYTHGGLYEIEDTLTWSEENFRSPQINCLEGWGIPTEPPDSPNNRRWMRVFTTMSLTHSDGYVMYTTGTGAIPGPDPDAIYPWGPGHEHWWYPFWDANLGRPIGPKAQLYQNVEGLFIREFTNGWAVYNRSGKPQTVTLPAAATPVSDRGNNAASQTHTLPDLDGEIYLKAAVEPPTLPYDLNKDGVVNVLDLILIAQNFGSTEADINGDGTTNILDLILVAQHLGVTSTPAAPAAVPASLSPEKVQEWIDMAYAHNDGSIAFVQGIATLERLLASMVPDKTMLRANYPNPFNPETWIPYHLANDTAVRISIYDIHGALVRQLNLGHQRAGYYTNRTKAAYWDGRNEIGESVASGVYFYTLTTDDYTGTRRMVIVK